jgi:hypothetical protein
MMLDIENDILALRKRFFALSMPRNIRVPVPAYFFDIKATAYLWAPNESIYNWQIVCSACEALIVPSSNATPETKKMLKFFNSKGALLSDGADEMIRSYIGRYKDVRAMDKELYNLRGDIWATAKKWNLDDECVTGALFCGGKKETCVKPGICFIHDRDSWVQKNYREKIKDRVI